jgi:flagellar biosynthesis/type III secretory pathway protein FliH
VRREVWAATKEAEAILARAEARAKASTEALEEAETRTADAEHQRNHEEKLAIGTAEILKQLGRIGREEIEGLPRVVALARLLAERIIGHALATDERTVSAMAATLLEEVRGARRVTFELHPSDVDLVRRALEGLGSWVAVTVSAQPALARGDFVVRTDVGSLSGRLGERLELLARKLAEGLDA